MASTIFLTLNILSTVPTELPPNFNTFIEHLIFNRQFPTCPPTNEQGFTLGKTGTTEFKLLE